MKKFGREAESLFLLVGMTVGIGMFGIPFVFARAGFLTGVLDLALLTFAVIMIHLAYTDIVYETEGTHRLPGYVRYYFGSFAGSISLAANVFGLAGSLLAYIVLGGFFLHSLIAWVAPDVPAFFGPLLFYVIGSAVMFRGIRFGGVANSVLTLALIAAIVLLGVSLLPFANGSFLFEFSTDGLFIPYGVLMFSLAGAAVIPDMRNLLGSEKRGVLRRLTVFGTIAASALYFLFAVAVVGATGDATTPDAVGGIATSISGGYLLAGALIGFLAAMTSFIPLGNVFYGVLRADVGLSMPTSWLVVAGIPALLYMLGFQNFILIISLIGAIGIGLDSIFILAMHRRLPRAHGTLSIPRPVSGILALMFIGGIAVEVFRFL